MTPKRCAWAEGSALEAEYHDREWGVPVHDDRTLFEFLTLEGAQAGLSWRTVLNKRDGYREVFLDYHIARLARLTDAQLEKRMTDARVVRNRLKIWSVRSNAQAALRTIGELGSLDALLWSFVDGAPLQPRRRGMGDVPARSDVSDRMSKALAKRGFKFVGSTIMYAYMQATGMVNDHLLGCPRHAVCAALATD
jgi:DNA-3-methyladenine glycosylase I